MMQRTPLLPVAGTTAFVCGREESGSDESGLGGGFVIEKLRILDREAQGQHAAQASVPQPHFSNHFALCPKHQSSHRAGGLPATDEVASM